MVDAVTRRRLAWAICRWLWLPILVLSAYARGVTSMGWGIIGFLSLLWFLGRARDLVWAHGWWVKFDDADARRTALAMWMGWGCLWRGPSHDQDGTGSGGPAPRLRAVGAAHCGWVASVETVEHARTLSRLQDRAGQMARDLGVPRLEVVDRGSGSVAFRGWVRDPLSGVRAVDHEFHPLRIARQESGDDLALDLVEASGHLALQGATRSGKSVTAYGLLGTLSDRDDAEVWGLDPTGVLLDPWDGRPGRRAYGLADLDDHVGVVSAAVAEMDRRIAQLRERGVDKINPTSEMPALVFVLEEWPGEIKALKDGDMPLRATDRREPRVRAGVSRLIAEGAKVGVRVVMIAQRFDASIVGGAERSNIVYRITHRVDNRDAVVMLHESATAEIVTAVTGDPVSGREGFAPGEALYQGLGGLPVKIKVDGIDYDEYRELVVSRARVRS